MNVEHEKKLMRRVAGYHDIRMDGLTDLVLRARGASVMDVGCNRGLVGFEFANNGATVVHGCDNYAEGIATARQLFADLRAVDAQFECVDLTRGVAALKPFGSRDYDITLMLATFHKLKRLMPEAALGTLVSHFMCRTVKWFAWRGTSDKPSENEIELKLLDRWAGAVSFRRVHTSYLSKTLGVAAIWERL